MPWEVDAPNHGFMLLDDDDGGRRVPRVLLGARASTAAASGSATSAPGACCRSYRFHSLRLLKALLAQDGYHFTDLSPSGNVVAAQQRLSFRFLDTTTALVPEPALADAARPRPDQLATPSVIAAHADRRASSSSTGTTPRTGAARHVVLIRGDEWCYVMFRRDRRKNLPLFASVLYVSNPALFRGDGPAVRPPPAAAPRRAGDPGRASGRRPPAAAVAAAAVAAPEDVPQRQPGARADRLPLQRARLRRLVSSKDRTEE